MVVEYFKSAVCPRCINVSRELANLKKEFPELEIKAIEIITNMSYAREQGVKGIPFIKMGENKMGGKVIPSHVVREFVLKHMND
jgi:glutaredoxin